MTPFADNYGLAIAYLTNPLAFHVRRRDMWLHVIEESTLQKVDVNDSHLKMATVCY